MNFGVICVEVSRKFPKNGNFFEKIHLHRAKISIVFLHRCPHPPQITLVITRHEHGDAFGAILFYVVFSDFYTWD